MRLGAHTSVAGGLHLVFERLRTFDGTAVQIFSKNNNRWSAPPLTDEALESWESAVAGFDRDAIAIHDSYLINLCSPDADTLARSFEAFVDEHRRAAQLGIRLMNFHPGAAMSQPREDALKIVAEQMNRAHQETAGLNTISVIETTAGQGSTLGYRFEEVATILDLVEDRERAAVCIDTCHIHAAGYDMRTEEAYHATMDEFDQIVGLDRLVLLHINDSKNPLGSRVDRHEHIGKGQIGEAGFRALMNDPRMRTIPKVLETPKGKDMKEDLENITLLRSFVASTEEVEG